MKEPRLNIFNTKGISVGNSFHGNKHLGISTTVCFSTHLAQFYQMIIGKNCPYAFEFERSKKDLFFELKKDKILSFNINLLEKCSDEYFLSILIHEFFHLITQNLVYKSDVDKLKESLTNPFMVIFDIEADLYTGVYFNNYLSFSLEEFLGLLFENRQMFLDNEIRLFKLTRFIGTCLSIVSYYNNGNYKVFLPSFTRWHIDKKLTFVIKEGYHHVYLNRILTASDLEKIKNTFDGNVSMHKNQYIQQIINFSYKLL